MGLQVEVLLPPHFAGALNHMVTLPSLEALVHIPALDSITPPLAQHTRGAAVISIYHLLCDLRVCCVGHEVAMLICCAGQRQACASNVADSASKSKLAVSGKADQFVNVSVNVRDRRMHTICNLLIYARAARNRNT